MHVNVHLFLSFLGMIVGLIICNIHAHKVENNYVGTIKIVADEIIALTELKYYILKGHMLLMVENAQLAIDNFQLNPTFTTLPLNLFYLKIYYVINQSINLPQNS